METLTLNNVQSQIDNENVFIQSSRNFLGIEIQLIENHPGENHWIYDKTNNTLDTVELVIDVYELLEKKLNKRLKKQPLVAKLINTVIEYDIGVEAELLSIGESFDEYGKKIESLVDKFENKEIKSHLKNVGFNMKTISDNLLAKMDVLGFPENNNMASELIDDKINAIVVSQKAKRLIKKVYSEKHRDLVNQDTIDKFKIIVEKDIDIKKIRSLYSNKMASFKDVNDANQRLDKFINTISGWTKELYLKKSKNLNVEVISSKDDILCLKIKDYNQSKEMGSGQWCLSYDEYYFNSYKSLGKSLFFVYDFSKEQSDRESMYGIIPNIGDDSFIGHWRDDLAITSSVNISKNWPKESVVDLVNNVYIDLDKHKKINDIKFIDINDLCVSDIEYVKIVNYSIEVEALDRSYFQYRGEKINNILKNGSNALKKETRNTMIQLLDLWDITKIDTDIIKTICLLDDEDISNHFNNISDNNHLSYTIQPLLGNESVDRQDFALSIFKKQKEKDPMNQIFNPQDLAIQLVKLSSTSVNDLSNFMKECILINGGHCELDPILFELTKNSEKNYMGNLDLLEIICKHSINTILKFNWECAESKYIDELKKKPKLFNEINEMINNSTKKKEIKKNTIKITP